VNTNVDLKKTVERWTSGRLVFRSSMYTGRGPTLTDMDSMILENIYRGILRDVGQVESTNFAKFVANLVDLSASAFIQAFEAFWHGGCKDTNPKQREGSGDQITGQNTDECFGEGIYLIGKALCGQNRDENYERYAPRSDFGLWSDESPSDRIKSEFVHRHKQEIDAA